MGQCCSNEDSKRQRAADFARCAGGGELMGAAESPLKAAALAQSNQEQQPRVFHIGGPRPKKGGNNSIFGLVGEATDRALSDDEEDEDDPGEDELPEEEEEETIEFYNSRATKLSAVDHHRLVRPSSSRRERPSSSSNRSRNSSSRAAGGAVLSEERKREIERMIIEEGGDNAAVLRRILAEQQQQQQERDAPPPEPQQQQQPKPKKKKFFGFRSKEKNKSESTVATDAATKAAPSTTEEPSLQFSLMESVQTTVIREDLPDDAPSDEESFRSPSIPRGIVQRRTNKFSSSTATASSAAASPGRLVPIKLKTQSSASPESIKIHHASSSDKKESRSSSKISLETPAPASNHRAHNKKDKTPRSTASIGEHQYSDFQKLQLKVAVAKKRAQKHHRVAKVEDRLKDVQGYNKLWQNFEKIQQTVQGKNKHQQTTTTPATETNSSTADTPSPVTPISAATDDLGSSPSPVAAAAVEETVVDVASPPVSKEQDAPVATPAKDDAAVVVEYDLEEEDVLPEKSQQQQQPIEYDLAEDLGFKKGGGSMASSIRSFTSRSSRKSSKSNGSSTAGGGGRRRRRFRRRNRKIEQEDEVVVASKDDSFKLNESQTWYFDFQDEFEDEDAPKGGDEAGTTGSNNSQASLSLLSQSSLEAQRRFFSEKRRQRKLKERQAALPPTVPAKPVGKNDPITGYGLEPVGKANAVGATEMEFDLVETPMKGNLHRGGSSSIANRSCAGTAEAAVDYQRMTPAQQLLACKDNPALRQQIAANILRSRALTNMEVTFSSPESGTGDDEASMVSDLDDNMSVTSVSGYISTGSRGDYGYRRRTSANNDNRSVTSYNSSRCRNDYGVSRRRRPSMASQSSIDGASRTGGDGDQSTVDAASTTDSVSAIGSSAYDHEIVLKRRLEIEAKLRALQAEDADDDNPSATAAELPDTSQFLPVVSPADNINAHPQSPSGDAMDARDDYVLPAVLSPKDVRTQRKREKAPETVYPAVARGYLVSPMFNGKLCSSSPDAKRVESNSPVSKSQNVSPEQSHCKSEEQEASSSKLNESFESEISSRSRITLPYLRSAKADSSKRAVTGQDDNDSLVATHSTASVSRSVTPSSGSGKESTHPHVIYENETPVAENSKGSLSGARDTLLLADQVEARVKDVLHRYRSGPEVATSLEEEDDQPPRIVSPRASWIR